MKLFFMQLWADRALILYQILHAPALLWAVMEKAPEYRFFVVVGLVALLVLLISAVVRLVKSRGKKIFNAVFFLLFSIVAAGAVLCVSYRGAEHFALPEKQRMTIGGETVSLSPQYSLAHGQYGDRSVYAPWRLADTAVCWKIGEGRAAALWDLDTLREDGTSVVWGLERQDGDRLIRLLLNYSGSDEGVYYNTNADLDILILERGDQVAPLWKLEPGDSFDPMRYRIDSLSFDCTVLENDGVSLVLAQDDGENASTLCLFQRCGEDTVLFRYRGSTSENKNENNNLQDTINNQFRSFRSLDPLRSERDRDDMLQTLRALADERFRLLTGLEEEELSALLPDRITAYPVGFHELRDCFSIPCSELVEMTGSSDERPSLRFIGRGPDGEDCLYTLEHGGGWFYWNSWQNPHGWFSEWDSAYSSGKKAPDRAMTAFLGATAVKYHDGWLLNAGLIDGDEMNQNDYYYLTITPLAGAEDAETPPAG